MFNQDVDKNGKILFFSYNYISVMFTTRIKKNKIALCKSPWATLYLYKL